MGEKNVNDIFMEHERRARERVRATGNGSRRVFDSRDIQESRKARPDDIKSARGRRNEQVGKHRADKGGSKTEVDPRNRVKNEVEKDARRRFVAGGGAGNSSPPTASNGDAPGSIAGTLVNRSTGRKKVRGGAVSASQRLNVKGRAAGEDGDKSGSIRGSGGGSGNTFVPSAKASDLFGGAAIRNLTGSSNNVESSADRRRRVSGGMSPLGIGLGGSSSGDEHARGIAGITNRAMWNSGDDDSSQSSITGFLKFAAQSLGDAKNTAPGRRGKKKKGKNKKKKKIVAGVIIALIFFMFFIFSSTAVIIVSAYKHYSDSSLLAESVVIANEAGGYSEDEESGGDSSGSNRSSGFSRGSDAGDSAESIDGDRLYGSDGGGDSDIEGITNRQLENARHVLAATKRLGLSRKATEDVFTAVWVESHFWNLANDGSGSQGALKPDQNPEELRKSMEHPESDGLPSDHGYGHGGDHGSVGLMQQQYPWWGTIDELMTQEIAIEKFVERYKQLNVEGLDSPQAIQKVQGSAHADGSNYRMGRETALKILEAVE